MSKIIVIISCLAALSFSGCNQVENTTTKQETKREVEIVKVDLEAARLGFPEVFISKEQDQINWSEASHERVADMDVEIYDTGRMVEVCGGIGCDK